MTINILSNTEGNMIMKGPIYLNEIFQYKRNYLTDDIECELSTRAINEFKRYGCIIKQISYNEEQDSAHVRMYISMLGYFDLELENK